MKYQSPSQPFVEGGWGGGGGGDSGPSGCSGGKEIPTHFALKCGRDLPCSHSNGNRLT